MRKIPIPPNEDAIEELLQALTYKNGKPKYRLKDDEIKIIRDIYKKYDSTYGIPHDDFKSVNLTPGTNDAIYNGYDEIQDNRRLKNLRSRILLVVSRCPYCGILPADELDHHLPRSMFKALSVFSSNLVPLCHKCNNKKRTVTGEVEGQRFFHVYFDELPLFPILIADVEFKQNALTFKFRIDNLSIEERLFNQLTYQINRINLNERLQGECNIYLFNLKAAIETVFDEENPGEVQKLLNKQIFDNEKKFGINDWRTALLKSIVKCDEFCNGGFEGYFNQT